MSDEAKTAREDGAMMTVKELKKRASGVNERIEEIVGDLGFEPAQNSSSA